jgi:hypothetical protein
MRIIRLVLVISLALLVGCAHKQVKDNVVPSMLDANTVPLEQLAQENQTNINKLTVGISKSAVLEAMGTKNATAFNSHISNPFRTETFQDKSGAQYEILYYATEDTLPFQPAGNAQMTPLILKNGALIGWGSISLKRAMEQTTEEAR